MGHVTEILDLIVEIGHNPHMVKQSESDFSPLFWKDRLIWVLPITHALIHLTPNQNNSICKESHVGRGKCFFY